MKVISTLLLLAVFILLMPLYGITNRVLPNIFSCIPKKVSKENDQPLSFLTKYTTISNTFDTAKEERSVVSKAISRQEKIFKVYPNPASNIVYLRISGRQTITLHNAKDSLIFRTSIREKALINIKKLPVGIYYFTDEKTGITKEMIIAR